MVKVINGAIPAVICLLLLYFSPDVTSMIFVGVMTVLVFTGYIAGIYRINGFSEGFRFSLEKLNDMKKVSLSENWLYLKQIDSFFHDGFLDHQFQRYMRKIEEVQANNGKLMPDVENYINDDYLSLRCQKSFLSLIPGTLTGLGILGTFYGLIKGLGGIRFSSVDVVVDTISSLVSGIDTAFYTSIAGVALSLCFDILVKISWNRMLEDLLEFYERFHSCVFPSEQEQKDNIQLSFYSEVLTYLEREQNEKKAV